MLGAESVDIFLIRCVLFVVIGINVGFEIFDRFADLIFKIWVAISFNFLGNKVCKNPWMQGFQGIKFGGPFAVMFFELVLTSLGIFQRCAWQSVLLALFFR